MEPWLIGMQLALLGCFCSAIGLVLLKHSTNVESNKPFLHLYFGCQLGCGTTQASKARFAGRSCG